MSKAIKQAGKRGEPDENPFRGRTWYDRRGSESEYPEDQSTLSCDACLIHAYMKDSKGLHVRRTLDQSHYSMLPSTEERDMDQILLKRGRLATEEYSQDHRRTVDAYEEERLEGLEYQKNIHARDESSLKVVMVDQLWLWMFEGIFLSGLFTYDRER